MILFKRMKPHDKTDMENIKNWSVENLLVVPLPGGWDIRYIIYQCPMMSPLRKQGWRSLGIFPRARYQKKDGTRKHNLITETR